MSIATTFARLRRRKLYSVTFIRCYNAAISHTRVLLSSGERTQLRRLLDGLQQIGHTTLGTVRPARGALTLGSFVSFVASILTPRVVEAVFKATAAPSSRSVRPWLVVPVWEFEPENADGSRLVASATFLGAQMLVEALRVTEPDYPEPVGAVSERFDSWCAAATIKGLRPETVRIPGWTGDYVVFASPLAS